MPPWAGPPTRAGAAVALAAALAGPLTAAPLPRQGQAWIAIDTPAFQVLSNASEERTRELLSELETFRGTLTALLGESTTASALPTLVHVFRSAADFSGYAVDVGECRGTRCAAGWFLAARQANLMAIDASVEEAPRVVLHEYVHFLVENAAPACPLWLNEGLAEFFSTFAATRRGAVVGRPIDGHLRLLRQEGLLPLAQLFAVDYDSPLYRDHQRAGVFYAQSWALTHYLLVGREERSAAAGELFAELAAGEPVEGALGSAGLESQTLQRTLSGYVRGRSFGYEVVPLAAGSVPHDLAARSVGRPEALARLGYLLAQFDERALGPAEEHCRTSLAEAPAESWALLCLAQTALVREQPDVAERRAAEAAAASPGEPLAHELLGHALLDRTRALRLSALPPEAEDRVRRARASFERAVALAPSLAPALAGLGLTYYWDPDPTPGLEPAERAARLMPHREDLVFDYLALAGRAGAVERAQAAYALLARQASRLAPEHLAEASRVVFESELARWQSGLRSPEDYAEGLERLDALLARAPDEATRREWATERDELARTVDRNRLVELYNQAVTLANSGRGDEAEILLRRVAGNPLDPMLAVAAHDLLRQLER